MSNTILPLLFLLKIHIQRTFLLYASHADMTIYFIYPTTVNLRCNGFEMTSHFHLLLSKYIIANEYNYKSDKELKRIIKTPQK